MLVNICNALAIGLIQQWVPKTPKSNASDKISEAGETTPKKKKETNNTTKQGTKNVSVSISPEAGQDLKKAIEVKF